MSWSCPQGRGQGREGVGKAGPGPSGWRAAPALGSEGPPGPARSSPHWLMFMRKSGSRAPPALTQ